MRLLVLGGTWFVGHAIVSAAIDAGWEVTTFNRGTSDPFLEAVRSIRGDRTRMEDITALSTAGQWDAVIDTSGYVPSNTLAIARTLAPVVGRYVFMSTVSVYRDWPVKPLSERSEVLYSPPDAGPDYGTDTEDGPTQYGYQKSGCEAAAVSAFGADRTTILRPGVVVGPREYVGRLPWWLRRVAAGGEVLAPGSADRTIQPVDVRDLAAFALRTIADEASGAFNVCSPMGNATFGELLADCAHSTRADASLTWVPNDFLLRQGVRQWSELPLWRTFDGVWRVDATAAEAAGLRTRPLEQTVRETWRWLVDSGDIGSHDRAAEIGISPEKEAQVLAAWRRSGERSS
ncbi:NAD-dependent epimerase/dehydratase family protein [Micromonospora sp. NPDC051300]|uniref:NAD-dependent epimerase/dehydratase family protein n=1 Tax=Micromonospora sp. NPDC051300 TaxID=3364286 RepID=UPI0037A673E3